MTRTRLGRPPKPGWEYLQLKLDSRTKRALEITALYQGATMTALAHEALRVHIIKLGPREAVRALQGEPG